MDYSLPEWACAVLSKFQGFKTNGNTGREWKVCCPVHDDAEQSAKLTIEGTGDGEMILFRCYKGCTFDEMLSATGTKASDFRSPSSRRKSFGKTKSRDNTKPHKPKPVSNDLLGYISKKASAYRDQLESHARREVIRAGIADRLGFSVAALDCYPLLGIHLEGKNQDEAFVAIPEVNADLQPIAIQHCYLYATEGGKRKRRQEQGPDRENFPRGIIVPSESANLQTGRRYITEGWTDAGGVTSCRRWAAARPSATNSADADRMMIDYLRRVLKPSEELVVLGDDDDPDKNKSSGVGEEGARRFAKLAADELGRAVKVAITPRNERGNDARALIQSYEGLDWESRGERFDCEIDQIAATVNPTSQSENRGSVPSDPVAVDKLEEAIKERRDEYENSDLQRATELHRAHGSAMCYVADAGEWYAFDRQRWVKDKGGNLVAGMAYRIGQYRCEIAPGRVGRAINELRLAQKSGDTERVEEVGAKLAELSRAVTGEDEEKWLDRTAVRNCVGVASTLSLFRESTLRKRLDREEDQHLLCCANGVINLRTGEMIPHATEFTHPEFGLVVLPKHNLTHLCPTEYDPNAKCPEFERFVREIFSDDPEKAKYVLRYLGYCLTGETKDQTFPIFFGDGANGKSLLLKTVQSLLGGDLATGVAKQTFVDPKDSHPTAQALLYGKRFTFYVETGNNGVLDVATMKALTGSDTVTARFMHQDFFEFGATHKMILATNHLPRVKDVDHGTWRRIVPIHFKRRFWKESDRQSNPHSDYREEDRADPNLEEKLLAEREGILALLVREAIAWYASGKKLTVPASIAADQRQYRQNEDLHGPFFDTVERCDGAAMKASDFHKAYLAWAEREGIEKPLKIRTFGIEAKKRGLAAPKASNSRYAVRIHEKVAPTVADDLFSNVSSDPIATPSRTESAGRREFASDDGGAA